MKKKILLLMLSLFLIGACAQQKLIEAPADFVGKGTEINPVLPQQAEEKAASISEVKGEVKEFKITAKRFEFEPSTIEVSKGDKVRLIVTSMDVTHGFSIREYDINKVLEPNNPVTIEFTADKEGDFTFFCSVPCGSGHGGMRGKLIVK